MSINFKEACIIYRRQFPQFVIVSALDVGDAWVMRALDRETGAELISSPIAVNKETGLCQAFFPPDNLAKLKDAVPVFLDMEANAQDL